MNRGESRRNVPVADDLLDDLRARPDTFGLERIPSEAGRLRELIALGAEAARLRTEAAAVETAYREWADDVERRADIDEHTKRVMAPGGLLDIAMGFGPAVDG
jgi:hypothetical protein